MYTKEEIASVFNKPELKTGLEKYLEIMGLLDNTDVSKNIDFQKKYNHFYRMRQRKPEFYQTYYSYMEKMKQKADSLSLFDEMFSDTKITATKKVDLFLWQHRVMKNDSFGVSNHLMVVT
jgi:hypothetical protein